MRSRDLSPQWAPEKMDYIIWQHDFQKLKFSLCLHLSCDQGFLLLLKLSSQLPRLGQRLAGVHYAVWLLKRKIFLFSSWSGLFRNQPQSFLRQASPRSWPATSPTASVLLQRQPKNMAMIGGWWVARKIFDVRIFDLGGIWCLDILCWDIWYQSGGQVAIYIPHALPL